MLQHIGLRSEYITLCMNDTNECNSIVDASGVLDFRNLAEHRSPPGVGGINQRKSLTAVMRNLDDLVRATIKSPDTQPVWGRR